VRLTTLQTVVTLLTFDAQCCHVGAVIKHPVPDRVKPSFVIFYNRAVWRSNYSFSPETNRCHEIRT